MGSQRDSGKQEGASLHPGAVWPADKATSLAGRVILFFI